MPLSFDFSLACIAPNNRLEFWHDVGSLVYRPIPNQYLSPSSLMVQARMQLMGEAVVGRMLSSEQYFERTERVMRRDCVDSFMLIQLVKGSMQWSGSRGHQHVNAGDLLLLDNHQICQSQWSAHEQIYAVLPRDLVVGSDLQEPGMSILRSGSPCAQILSDYLKTVCDQKRAASPEDDAKLVAGLASLTRIYFAESSQLEELESGHAEQTLTKAIQQWIDQRLGKSDLSMTDISQSFHISRSMLYELLQPYGGAKAYIQTRRLEQARMILEQTGFQKNIGTLAQSLGFRSLSSFSRSFHQHWGISPREVRRLAAEKHGVASIRQAWPDPMHQPEQLRNICSHYYQALHHLTPGRQPKSR